MIGLLWTGRRTGDPAHALSSTFTVLLGIEGARRDVVDRTLYIGVCRIALRADLAPVHLEKGRLYGLRADDHSDASLTSIQAFTIRVLDRSAGSG